MIEDIFNLTARQKTILGIIIQEFVETGEPVSSNTIIEKYKLNCSSATVRNEMVHLENAGYLKQPHSASGRVPLDPAYRFFVNEIIKNRIAPPSAEMVTAISRQYQDIKLQLQAVAEATASLLSSITNYTSLILTPTPQTSTFKHIKLISLEPDTILFFLLSSKGETINKVIRLSHEVTQEELDIVATLISKEMGALPLSELYNVVTALTQSSPQKELLTYIQEEAKLLLNEGQGDLILKGTCHLIDATRSGDIKNLKVMLELLEEEKVMAGLLTQSLKNEELNISIGNEIQIDEMKDCSIVTAAYKIKEKPVGILGILGPKRMPYRRVISIITYTAENVSQKLDTMDSI